MENTTVMENNNVTAEAKEPDFFSKEETAKREKIGQAFNKILQNQPKLVPNFNGVPCLTWANAEMALLQIDPTATWGYCKYWKDSDGIQHTSKPGEWSELGRDWMVDDAGYVWVRAWVKSHGIVREEEYNVMDSKNNPVKNVAQTLTKYTSKQKGGKAYEDKVEAADSNRINYAKKRALAKCIAQFGIGLEAYAKMEASELAFVPPAEDGRLDALQLRASDHGFYPGQLVQLVKGANLGNPTSFRMMTQTQVDYCNAYLDRLEKKEEEAAAAQANTPVHAESQKEVVSAPVAKEETPSVKQEEAVPVKAEEDAPVKAETSTATASKAETVEKTAPASNDASAKSPVAAKAPAKVSPKVEAKANAETAAKPEAKTTAEAAKEADAKVKTAKWQRYEAHMKELHLNVDKVVKAVNQVFKHPENRPLSEFTDSDFSYLDKLFQAIVAQRNKSKKAAAANKETA